MKCAALERRTWGLQATAEQQKRGNGEMVCSRRKMEPNVHGCMYAKPKLEAIRTALRSKQYWSLGRPLVTATNTRPHVNITLYTEGLGNRNKSLSNLA